MGLLSDFLPAEGQGLLSGVLPAVYSRADAAKRALAGLLSDPLGTVQQALGQAQDSGNAQLGLMDRAFAPGSVTDVRDPQALAQATNALMAGPLGMAPAGMIVYHGSPHVFDAFDSSKIGTGEGAQAYGHGLYVAESPAVAKSYQKSTSYQDMVRQFRSELPDDADFSELLDMANGGRLTQQSSAVVKALAHDDWLGFDYPAQAITAAFKSLRNYDASPELRAAIANYGNLYKADLADSAIPRMLNWDAPFVQQPPSVQNALGQFDALGGKQVVHPNATGEYLYNRIGDTPGARDSAATLNWLGIPGIRYLDGSSRGAGTGTSNFVIFPGNENLLTILERNGVPLGR